MRLRNKADQPDFDKALDDWRNRAVTMHKPGSTVTMRDGAVYVVMPDGSWRRKDAGEEHKWPDGPPQGITRNQ